MGTTEIVNELYDRYYIHNSTPEDIISSHWKHYQNQVKVRISEGNIESLVGSAFGDLEQRAITSRILSWMTIGSYWLRLPHRMENLNLLKSSIGFTKRMGLPFTYDCFRQVCSLGLVNQYMAQKNQNGKLNVIIIGDGYGFLASLIKEIYPRSTILLVDLGRILLFQAHYCGKAHANRSHFLMKEIEEFDQKELSHDFVYCPAEHLGFAKNLSFDLAINIASMQEMNQQSILGYFSFLRGHLNSDNLFYCCNREEKTMSGGEISRFLEYPWREKDIHLIDEYCHWYRYFLSLHRAQNGPEILKFRIPLVNYFDGLIRHRLTVLETTDDCNIGEA
ncbi:MAG: putative sugar O-methyltransferase [Planctomycetes bacterium]|nr:putative sugar O-methyltransferase [Planctomycetota bacterium]